MPNYLTISPEEFHFQAPYTNSSEIVLNLTNASSDQHVAFKVKTIDPKRYVVKPTSGVVAPGQTATVKVTFQALASQELVAAFAKSKQKFMVQYRAMNGTPGANETAATLMTKPDGGQMMEKKIECRFDFDNGAFKTTNEQGPGGVSTGTPGGAVGGASSGAIDDAVAPFQSSSDAQQPVSGCPISRCLRFLLIALLILLIALALGYQFGDKAKDVAQKVAHQAQKHYEHFRAQHG